MAAKRTPHPALDPRKLKADSERIVREARQTGVAFCLSDLDIAFTMLDRARVTHDRQTRERNIDNAQRAHDSVKSILGGLGLEAQDKAIVDRRLLELEERLGEARARALGAP